MPDEPQTSDATQSVRIPEDKTQPMTTGGGETDATRPVSIDKSGDGKAPSKESQPASTQAPSEVDDSGTEDDKPPRSIRGRIILLGIVFVLIVGSLGGYLGYRSGLQGRVDQHASQVAAQAATQFQLGLDDMANQRYEMAKGRFEYVISLDPNFPGVKEKLSEVMFALLPTASPTATLTPTPAYTPTPDTRGEDEMFSQIQQLLANKKWDDAINTIEALRTKKLDYKTVEVDGLYYIALRYRGVDKILVQGDLEGGIYDLTLASRFGPLDRDAESYQVWARYYITGASFWQVDWEKATYYFGLVAPYLPNLRDSSNVFAIDRYRQAATNYAQQLMDGGDACKASDLLNTVLVNNYTNATAEPLATKAWDKCHPPTKTPTPEQATETPTETATLAITAETPTESAAVPTATPTQPQPATATPTTQPKQATPSPTPKPPTSTPVPPTATTEPPTPTFTNTPGGTSSP